MWDRNILEIACAVLLQVVFLSKMAHAHTACNSRPNRKRTAELLLSLLSTVLRRDRYYVLYHVAPVSCFLHLGSGCGCWYCTVTSACGPRRWLFGVFAAVGTTELSRYYRSSKTTPSRRGRGPLSGELATTDEQIGLEENDRCKMTRSKKFFHFV